MVSVWRSCCLSVDWTVSVMKEGRVELNGSGLNSSRVDEYGVWPTALREGLERKLLEWERTEKIGRLWSGDQSLWTGKDEANWVGWLEISSDGEIDKNLALLGPSGVAGGVIEDVVLLGMGGSSMGAEAIVRSIARDVNVPIFSVLDSTNPLQVRSLRDRLTLSRTLFIVSSKSGRTFETDSLMHYFLDLVSSSVSSADPGGQFVAITDPGSELERFAVRRGFGHVFHGLPNIGGRFSVLSNFGLVPAAAAGIDIFRILERAREMRIRCAEDIAINENPGALLGIAMAVGVERGLDKLTVVASSRFLELGSWIEQMLAESTGKRATGLIPIEREDLSDATAYGDDRMFVYLRDTESPEPGQDERVSSLRHAGKPVVEISLRDGYDVGAEFFRWEFATAVVGAILQVNPFNQPDVEATKRETRRLTEMYVDGRALPKEEPLCVDKAGGLSVFADEDNAAALEIDLDGGVSIRDVIAAHLGRIDTGDYFAVLAYIEMSTENRNALQVLRHAVRDTKLTATSLQFGPRFLHSTGQSHKGGPNSGVFLEITSESPQDLPIPGRNYSFGQAGTAQALGDLVVLNRLQRRVIRVHLTGDVRVAVERLTDVVQSALGGSPGRTQ
jgi:transaldolase/glucose-6-phosphate isomerase